MKMLAHLLLAAAVGVLLDERADELGDLVLLMTRKLAGLLKDLPQLARRSLAACPAGVTAKEIFDGNVQRRGNGFDLLWAQRDGIAFPNGIGFLGDAQLLGNLSLRESGGFTRSEQSLAEIRAWFI